MRQGPTLLTVDNIAVALHYDEHVINPDAHKQEGNDGVHRTEDQPQARADAVAGEETEETTADSN